MLGFVGWGWLGVFSGGFALVEVFKGGNLCGRRIRITSVSVVPLGGNL